MEFLLFPENTVYVYTLFLLFSVIILELIGFLLGFSLLSSLNTLDISNAIDAITPLARANRVLNWLGISQITLSSWIVVFLSTVVFWGLVCNLCFYQFNLPLLPFGLSLSIALPLSLITTRTLSKFIASIFPEHETSAVTQDSFCGCVATLTLATARLGHPAEALYIDQYNQKHYLMVAPMDAGIEFHRSDTVILVEKSNDYYWYAMATSE